MAETYDVFLSHAWADGERPGEIAAALRAANLRVWFDAYEVKEFEGITRAVQEGVARSKVLLAYYGKNYPKRRACQWELTAAYLTASFEGDARRRVLVVNPEKGAGHIYPIELQDAKYVRAAPAGDQKALDALVQSVVRHVSGVREPLASIRPLREPNRHGMTAVGSVNFVGRLPEMWKIHSLLHLGDVTQISGIPAATGGIGQVSGLGGVGKSLLVEEYALRFGAAYPGGIFWLWAFGNDDAKAALTKEAREVLRESQIQGIAEHCGIETRGLSATQIRGALAREIGRRDEPCLWVVDDVPNGLEDEVLRRWFAPDPRARTLLTTRSREYGGIGRFELAVLAAEEAEQLLTSRRPPVGKAEEEEARRLAEDLGCHALALDVTASALVSSVAARPFADFRARLARDDRDAMELAGVLADALPNGHERSIAKTILQSVRRLGEEGKDFLRLASVLAVAPVPASLVVAVFRRADGITQDLAEEWASLAFQQVTTTALGDIAGAKQNARAVHTLVARTVRFAEKSSPERTEALRAAAVLALVEEISDAAEDLRLHGQIELQVAHGRQLVSAPTNEDEAKLAGWLGRYDFERGAYASARTLFGIQRGVCEKTLGPEHPETLRSINNLASALWAQGDLVDARALEEETLVIRRRVLGPEHPETLTLMGNLATTLRTQGDLAGARALQEEGLEIERRVLGPEHPDTLTSMNNLASTLYAQGDLAGARALQEETLAIRRRALGSEHPETLISRGNLAGTLYSQRDLVGARALEEETLAIRRRVLGPEHPSTSISAWNLFRFLLDLEESEAHEILRRELLWLLNCGPATLGADQREIRERVAAYVERHPEAG